MNDRYGHRVLMLITVLSILMLATSNLWGVIETSEARYAEISREMFRSGDWMHPTLLNIHHYHKPPITYWLTAISYSIFGVNAFAVRFFLTIAYCLQVLLILKIAQQLYNNTQTAWYAALVYATLPIVLISVRGLTTDAYLSTFVLLSMYWWIRYLKSSKVYYLYFIGVAFGLGFMTKGPVVFIVPAFAIMGLRKWLPIPRVNILHGILAFVLFLVVGFWWFAYVIKEDSRLGDYFVFRHLVDRFSNAEVFTRREPWYYYLPLIPLVSIPWIAPFVMVFFDKRTEAKKEDRQLVKYIGIWWFLLPLILYSISSSKLVLYILPLFVGFSLITAHFLQGVSKPFLAVIFGLILLIYTALLLLPFGTSLFSVEWWLTLFPAVFLLLSLYVWHKKLSSDHAVSILSVLFAIHLILYASFFFRFNSLQVNGITPVSTFIKGNNLVNRKILVYDALLPSLAFELDKEIISVYDGDRSLRRETQFEKNDDWENFLIDATDQHGLILVKEMIAEKSVLVVKTASISKLKSVMQGVWQEQNFGRWTVYYN